MSKRQLSLDHYIQQKRKRGESEVNDSATSEKENHPAGPSSSVSNLLNLKLSILFRES